MVIFWTAQISVSFCNIRAKFRYNGDKIHLYNVWVEMIVSVQRSRFNYQKRRKGAYLKFSLKKADGYKKKGTSVNLLGTIVMTENLEK
jgi:hypothetical protein